MNRQQSTNIPFNYSKGFDRNTAQSPEVGKRRQDGDEEHWPNDIPYKSPYKNNAKEDEIFRIEDGSQTPSPNNNKDDAYFDIPGNQDSPYFKGLHEDKKISKFSILNRE